jgi:hypothetical protein
MKNLLILLATFIVTFSLVHSDKVQATEFTNANNIIGALMVTDIEANGDQFQWTTMEMMGNEEHLGNVSRVMTLIEDAEAMCQRDRELQAMGATRELNTSTLLSMIANLSGPAGSNARVRSLQFIMKDALRDYLLVNLEEEEQLTCKDTLAFMYYSFDYNSEAEYQRAVQKYCGPYDQLMKCLAQFKKADSN